MAHGVRECQSVRVEVRGQPSGICSFLKGCVVGTEPKWSGKCSRSFHPLSHLSSPKLGRHCLLNSTSIFKSPSTEEVIQKPASLISNFCLFPQSSRSHSKLSPRQGATMLTCRGMGCIDNWMWNRARLPAKPLLTTFSSCMDSVSFYSCIFLVPGVSIRRKRDCCDQICFSLS